MTIMEALNAIVEDTSKGTNWARNYARYGMLLVDKFGEDHPDVYVQLRYVLGNITHWRGKLAREVRTTLKLAIERGNNK